MTSITAPEFAKRRWNVLSLPILLAALVVALLAAGIAWYATRPVVTKAHGVFHPVTPMDLIVSIKKDGELQAVNNIDIVNPVEGQSTIQFIVKEGSYVKKGDTVVVLESSEIARKLQDAELALQKSESDLTFAKEAQTIQEQKNAADLLAAEVELELARLDLREYFEGTYPQDAREAEKAVKMSTISLQNKEEELRQVEAMYNRGFQTAADLRKAELEVVTAQNDLERKTSELQVLQTYTYEKELTDRRNKVVQAERRLARQKTENRSSLAQKVAEVIAKERAFETQKYQTNHLREQLEACTIKAPSDGLVLYASSTGGGRDRQNPIAAGSQVRQQEMLIRLPDTSAMKAVVKIQEAWISRLRMDEKDPMRANVNIVGLPNPVGAIVTSVSLLPDNSQRWWNPDLKEFPVELALDDTPAGLKPGNSVTVQVVLDHIKQALAVPLTALYSVGRDRYVFVKDGEHLRPTKIELGKSNETHAQIASGLEPGQQVLLLQVGQGRELLEAAGIRSVAPTTRPADGAPEGAVARSASAG